MEELATAGVPYGNGNDTFGIKMAGNTVLMWGTEEQKQQFLPRILSGADRWCQGYSEPGAGSDLASLRTRAVARRRRVGARRAEDLDLAGPPGELDLRAGPHRPGRAPAPGDLLPARADGPAGRGGAPHPLGDGGERVQRGLPRRGPHPAGERRRPGERRVEGRPDPAGLRARRRGGDQPDPVPRRVRPARRAGAGSRGRRRPDRARPAGPAARRGGDHAVPRLPRADGLPQRRGARAGGVDRQAVLERVPPARHRPRARAGRDARPGGHRAALRCGATGPTIPAPRTPPAPGSAATSTRAPAPSTPARRRSSGTSSPRRCWACRRSPDRDRPSEFPRERGAR